MIYCLLTLPHPHLSPNCWVSPPEYNIYRDTKIISQSGPSWPSKDYRPSKQKCFTYNQLMDYQLIQWRHPPFKTTINHYSKPRHFLLRKYFHCLTFLYRSVEWKELSILDLPQTQHIWRGFCRIGRSRQYFRINLIQTLQLGMRSQFFVVRTLSDSQ